MWPWDRSDAGDSLMWPWDGSDAGDRVRAAVDVFVVAGQETTHSPVTHRQNTTSTRGQHHHTRQRYHRHHYHELHCAITTVAKIGSLFCGKIG